jgi:hypothetical protein
MGDESIGPRYLDKQEQRLYAKDMRESAESKRSKYLDVQREAGV